MMKKASAPEPASMAAQKPAKKSAADGSTAKPAKIKRIAARVVKATEEDTSPEPAITAEHVPDQKVKPPSLYMWGSMAFNCMQDRCAPFRGHLNLVQTLDYSATSGFRVPLP